MYNLKHEAIMYIDNDEFGGWMQKLYAKLEELCKDVRVLPVSYTHLRAHET